MHRLPQILIVVILLVLGFYVGQPYLDRMLFSASTPRAVTPRGSLADIERTTIELFERASPSVVQVVARAGGPEAMQSELGRCPEPVGHRLHLGRRRPHRHQRSRRARHRTGRRAALDRTRAEGARSSAPRPTTTSRCCASTTPARCRRRSRSAVRRT